MFETTKPWFGFGSDDVWTLFHSDAFDFSVWEIWGALLHGGRLVVVPRAVSRSPAAMLDLITAEGVTVLNQTPSAFYYLMDADGEQPRQDLPLRHVIFGGEALNLARLNDWYGTGWPCDAPQLVNMYGITETTVHVTYQRLDAALAHAATGSLIGRDFSYSACMCWTASCNPRRSASWGGFTSLAPGWPAAISTVPD